jgi:hypothetical protein
LDELRQGNSVPVELFAGQNYKLDSIKVNPISYDEESHGNYEFLQWDLEGKQKKISNEEIFDKVEPFSLSEQVKN